MKAGIHALLGSRGKSATSSSLLNAKVSSCVDDSGHGKKWSMHMQDYPEGALVCPVDLIKFDPQHAPAVHRMLGHCLIALNDRVATEVVHR